MFIWLLRVLVAAPGIFSRCMQTLSCGVCDPVPWLGIEPRSFALGAWSLSLWTTREVPEREGFDEIEGWRGALEWVAKAFLSVPLVPWQVLAGDKGRRTHGDWPSGASPCVGFHHLWGRPPDPQGSRRGPAGFADQVAFFKQAPWLQVLCSGAPGTCARTHFHLGSPCAPPCYTLSSRWWDWYRNM